ncbi:uncharacterized protein E0L32_003552 [Thyridium curvatum]|uniref:Protein kinase domain-containing protein n=1 Tax=Thyridium curvatum TaxID=1093900 RepID=A0A507BK00_9PEZI|nr:uncharacterized protein E0L32_003552 [Thyridium curvatum]TPX16990.1 hypothetical protein E0L32_003552 [Thyridium curvatum]
MCIDHSDQQLDPKPRIIGGKRTGQYEPCQDRILREDIIYRHLGQHPRRLQYFGLEQVSPGVHSIRLELAPHGCLRQYIQDSMHNMPSLPIRFQMAVDVAEGLEHVHHRGVYSADLSARNAFLFEGFRIKLGGFGGSILRDPPDRFRLDQCYEGRYTLPPKGREYDEVDILKREIFALGCILYEIMAWKVPFGEVDSEEAEQRYDRGCFPSLVNNPLREVIWDCWAEVFQSADQVLSQLRNIARVALPRPYSVVLLFTAKSFCLGCIQYLVVSAGPGKPD